MKTDKTVSQESREALWTQKISSLRAKYVPAIHVEMHKGVGGALGVGEGKYIDLFLNLK